MTRTLMQGLKCRALIPETNSFLTAKKMPPARMYAFLDQKLASKVGVRTKVFM